MIRNLKVLGLSVVAVLAMTAVAASAASAAEFHSESGPAIFEGSQATTNEFKVTSGIVKCSGATFSGTQTNATSPTVTVHPTYTGCKAFGVNATVTTTGCDYVFNVTESATAPTTKVTCGENPIKVVPTGINCTVTVGAQEGLTSVTLANEGTGTSRDILATANVTNIVYTETGAGCVGGGTVNHTGGTYTGSVTMKGYVDSGGSAGAQQGIWSA